jgi:putative transposase
VTDHQAQYPIATMSRLLGVSTSGWYGWSKRQPSSRSKRDTELTTAIRAAHRIAWPLWFAARSCGNGIRIGRKRVARLMSRAGLAGVSRRRFVTTTLKDGGRLAPDLVDRNFAADAPDRLWIADITYILTWAGFLYLAVVLDVFSRRVIGWSMSTTLATQGVLDVLNMALAKR